MGYSPWGVKELDRTERLIHSNTTVLGFPEKQNQQEIYIPTSLST